MNVFHYAVLSDNAKVVQLLRNNIVDISLLNALAKDFLGGFSEMSPLAGACMLGKNNAVQALVENGSNINEEHYMGYSILSWSAYNCNIETIRFLLAHGAKHDYRHCDGYYP